ncbi:hypothetical protein FHR92_002463 [Fontibacillus solani]|uniref:Uncharacterized protein n=1 Tax=Fontibacillus solani TaxID=1572857 RepID=A0A7W3STK0_9BACL|nr:hypothetical protein [Fontibacillus solani]
MSWFATLTPYASRLSRILISAKAPCQIGLENVTLATEYSDEPTINYNPSH